MSGSSVRKFLGGLFGPMAPPVSSKQDVSERIEIAADILARKLVSADDSGFTLPPTARGDEAADVLDTARMLAWQRWRYETGQLHDGQPTHAAGHS